MLKEIKDEAKKRMQKSIEALQAGFAKIRTGRAHPSVLEHINVDYYGTDTPLNQVANVIIEDARTLSITPWEKSMIQPIEKAIMKADLGLNPATAGQVIRVPMPPLTEERRKEMVKIVRSEAEQGRVSVRNIRRDANSQLKDLLKDKAISEDEEHQGQDDIQKLTDQFVKEVDEVLAKKEEDLMSV